MNSRITSISKRFAYLTPKNSLSNLRLDAHRWSAIASPILVGFSLGVLVLITRQLPSNWSTLLLMLVPAFTALMLIANLDRTIEPSRIVLTVIMIGIVLNLDVTVVRRDYPGILMSFDSWRVSVVTVAIILGYALWLIEEIRSGPSARVHLFPSVIVPAMGLLVASIVSVVRAVDTTLSMFWIVLLIELIVTLFYIANQIKTRDDLNFFLVLAMLCFVLEVGLMVLQYYTGFQLQVAGVSGGTYGGASGGNARVTGTMGTANDAGEYAATGLLIAIGILLSSTKRSEKRLAALAVGLGAIALVVTFSRSSWRGFLLAVAGFLALGVLKGHIKIEIVLILLVLFCLVFVAFYSPIMTRLTSDDDSAKSRPPMAELAWGVIKAYPIWGVGANNYSLVAFRYAPPGFDPYPYVNVYRVGTHPVHNRYLLIWAELGLPGIVSFVLLLLAAALQGIKAANLPDRRLSLIALALVAALASYSIHLTTDHLLNRSLTRWVWLIIALLVSMNRVGKTRSIVS
jgi:putative inorganic carbon (HCO3(-)) transporter